MIYKNRYDNFICGPQELDDIINVYTSVSHFQEGSKKPSGTNVKIFFEQALENKFIVLGSKKNGVMVGYLFMKILDETEFMFIHHKEATDPQCLYELEILASMLAEKSGKLSYFYKADKESFFKEKAYSLINPDYNRYEKRIHSIVHPYESNFRTIEKVLIKSFIKRTKDIYVVHSLLKNTYVVDYFADNFNLSKEKIKKMVL